MEEGGSADRLVGLLEEHTPVEVVVETFPSWPWLFDLLERPGIHLVLDFIMAAVAKGEISIPGFDSEWADQTQRFLEIVVIMGTLMLVYPSLPGAGRIVRSTLFGP